MIEAYLGEDEDGDVVMRDEDGDEGDPPKIFLHAITGREASETMKIYGQIIDLGIS